MDTMDVMDTDGRLYGQNGHVQQVTSLKMNEKALLAKIYSFG